MNGEENKMAAEQTLRQTGAEKIKEELSEELSDEALDEVAGGGHRTRQVKLPSNAR